MQDQHTTAVTSLKNSGRKIRHAILCVACTMPGMTAWAQQTDPAPTAMCRLQAETTVHLSEINNHYLVPVLINGKSLLLEPDTGAADTLLKPDVADQLDLPDNSDHVLNLTGAGSPVTREHPHIASSLQIGTAQWSNVDVATAPTGLPEPAAGILGSDVLSRYDVEIDYPAKIMTLWAVHECMGRITPWKTGRYVAYRANTTLDHRFYVPVKVNGYPLQALVDTGARVLLMSPAAAQKVGIDDATLASDPQSQGRGVSGVPFDVHRHRFDSFQVGPTRYRNVVVDVSSEPLHADLLLGVSFLKWQRLWLSYSTGWVFMQVPPRTSGNAPDEVPLHDVNDAVGTPALQAGKTSLLAGAPFVLPPVNEETVTARFGIKPGSSRAAIVTRWAKEIADDPDIRRELATAADPPNGASNVLGRATRMLDGFARISRDDRTRITDIGVATMDNAPADCGGLKNLAVITRRYLPVQKMSDDEFGSYLQTTFDLLKQSAQTTPVPTLTPEQRLQAQLAVSASIAAALKHDPSATSDVAALQAHRPDMSPESWCRATRVTQHALQATAQPYRDWAVLASNEAAKQNIARIMALASLASLRSRALAQQPLSLDYVGKVQRRVRPNIIWAGATNNLETVVAVHCQPDGTITSATIVHSSGNADWDEAALRAVQRSNPMPVDTDGKARASFRLTLRPAL